MFTAIAVVFILFLLGGIFYGYGIMMRRPLSEAELRTEHCSLCNGRIDKLNLVERQVGDSKLFYFCHSCIAGLVDDAKDPLATSFSPNLPEFLSRQKAGNISD